MAINGVLQPARPALEEQVQRYSALALLYSIASVVSVALLPGFTLLHFGLSLGGFVMAFRARALRNEVPQFNGAMSLIAALVSGVVLLPTSFSLLAFGFVAFMH